VRQAAREWIRLFDRKTDFAVGAWTGSLASGGPIAVLVEEQDITVARRLIPSA